MPDVMIMCPEKKVAVPTGLAMDQQSFDSSTLTNNSVKCSACGNVHTWNKQDAFVAGSKTFNPPDS